MLEFLKDNYLKFIGGLVIILISIGGFVFYRVTTKNDNVEPETEVLEAVEVSNVVEEQPVEIPVKMINVDVKGLVNKPGVYQVEEGTIINSVIELAGGLKKGGTTKNINLSKKVSDEMVIYIYSEYQLNKMNESTEIKECNNTKVDISSCEGSSVVVNSNDQQTITSGKVSINNGTKEQLMTLSGIGEAKAIAIIEYRQSNGGFKKLEDIMNVSGIGEAAYNKIKDDIEL